MRIRKSGSNLAAYFWPTAFHGVKLLAAWDENLTRKEKPLLSSCTWRGRRLHSVLSHVCFPIGLLQTQLFPKASGPRDSICKTASRREAAVSITSPQKPHAVTRAIFCWPPWYNVGGDHTKVWIPGNEDHCKPLWMLATNRHPTHWEKGGARKFSEAYTQVHFTASFSLCWILDY